MRVRAIVCAFSPLPRAGHLPLHARPNPPPAANDGTPTQPQGFVYAGQRRPTAAHGRPTQDHEGPQHPTTANAGPQQPTEGQRRPTKAHSTQRRPTQANTGPQHPTTANEGQPRPTQVKKGPKQPRGP